MGRPQVVYAQAEEIRSLTHGETERERGREEGVLKREGGGQRIMGWSRRWGRII